MDQARRGSSSELLGSCLSSFEARVTAMQLHVASFWVSLPRGCMAMLIWNAVVEALLRKGSKYRAAAPRAGQGVGVTCCGQPLLRVVHLLGHQKFVCSGTEVHRSSKRDEAGHICDGKL